MITILCMFIIVVYRITEYRHMSKCGICMRFKNIWFSFSGLPSLSLKTADRHDSWVMSCLENFAGEVWAESPKVRLPDQALPCRHRHQRNLHDSTVSWSCMTIYSKRHWFIETYTIQQHWDTYNTILTDSASLLLSYRATLTSAFTSSFRWWRTMCLLLGIHKAAAMVSELKEGSITMMAPWTPLFWRLSANS